MEPGEALVEPRGVDPYGLVECPHRARPPTLADCAVCPSLVGTTIDLDGGVLLVRCRAGDRSSATSAAAPATRCR